MLSALGSLASFALPKLVNFAAKKLAHNTIGKAASTVGKVIKNPAVRSIARGIVSGFDDEDDPHVERRLKVERTP